MIDSPVNRLLLHIAAAVQITRSTDLAVLAILLNGRVDDVDEILSTESKVHVSIDLGSLDSKRACASGRNLALILAHNLRRPLGTAVSFNVLDDGLTILHQWGFVARLVHKGRISALILAGGDVARVGGAGALGGRIP